ncbi:MAG: hypothetical protein GYA24_05245 [Candidatus Lokiarchaeota archaeon]|nr:hypothetical protein [Candidatus Lokiarchaeota archaeon]
MTARTTKQPGNIDIEKLIEILPKLIRENDTVKGAIITALSGVVATRDDIKELIKEMDKRFEAVERRFEAADKRFEAVDRHFDKVENRLDTIDVTLLTMQNKTGPELERLILDIMRATLQMEHVDPAKIRKETIVDKKGFVFDVDYSTDIDVLVENGNVYLVEIKATADNRDVKDVLDKAKLYEHLHDRKVSGLLLVTLRINKKNFDNATRKGIRVIAGEILAP